MSFRAQKVKKTVYVDNLGRVTDTVSRKDPEAGNDVYLTIDKNLQESTYKLLEEKIAGIVFIQTTECFWNTIHPV